jgi:hypothetical protein
VQVACTQCGAGITVSASERVMVCPFCDTALVVDGTDTLFHEVMRPTIQIGDVVAHLRRFLGGRDTVANLDREAQLGEPVLEFFPFWAFTVAGDGGDRVELQPAAPSSLQGLQSLTLPTGETGPMSAEMTGEAAVIEPEVPVDTARQWLLDRHGSEIAIRRTVLYHLPLFRTPYSWNGISYRAAVDGVTGKVYPADFPTKAESPYALVAALALVVFGIEGLVFSNLLVKLAVYAVSAVPIVGLAWLVSKKV